MKLTTPENDQRRAISDVKSPVALRVKHHASRITRPDAAFTLAETMVALLLLAIVIPVAIKAISAASLAGEVAARKGSAARIADRVLNESLVLTNWSNGTQNGTTTEGGREFRWTLSSQGWPVDSAMQVVTADVTFSAQGKNFDMKLSTLASQASQTVLNVTQ